MDGKPKGRIKCSLKNWTGRVYSIPRTAIDETMTRAELRQSGVYFLLGNDPDSGEPAIYVGQAQSRQNGLGILGRIIEHKRDKSKDFFNRVIILIVADNSFGPTEITHLEHAFYNLAKDNERYRIMNGSTPSPGNVTEEQEAELAEFINYSKLVVAALGVNAFEPVVAERKQHNSAPDGGDEEPLLQLNHKNGRYRATGQQIAEGFAVLKGSEISPDTTVSCPKSTIASREDFSNYIENNVLLKTLPFGSASAAAAFVTGYSVNGKTAWVDEQGATLQQIEQREVAGSDSPTTVN